MIAMACNPSWMDSLQGIELITQEFWLLSFSSFWINHFQMIKYVNYTISIIHIKIPRSQALFDKKINDKLDEVQKLFK